MRLSHRTLVDIEATPNRAPASSLSVMVPAWLQVLSLSNPRVLIPDFATIRPMNMYELWSNFVHWCRIGRGSSLRVALES